MSVLTRLIVSIVTLFGTLVFEVVLAMLLFSYLAINHPDLFGSMANWSDQALASLKELIRSIGAPFDDAAFGGAVGDLSARGFLLLILGLLASGVIRMLVWFFRSLFARDY